MGSTKKRSRPPKRSAKRKWFLLEGKVAHENIACVCIKGLVQKVFIGKRPILRIGGEGGQRPVVVFAANLGHARVSCGFARRLVIIQRDIGIIAAVARVIESENNMIIIPERVVDVLDDDRVGGPVAGEMVGVPLDGFVADEQPAPATLPLAPESARERHCPGRTLARQHGARYNQHPANILEPHDTNLLNWFDVSRSTIGCQASLRAGSVSV